LVDQLIPWLPTGFLIVLIMYMLMHPEKVEKWSSIIARGFAIFSRRIERAYVARDIQNRINSFADVANSEVSGVLPYRIKIEWVKVKETTPEAFIKSGEIVVKMDHHRNQAKNLAHATIAYVSTGAIPRARQYINENVVRAIDFTIVKKIFVREGRHDALQIFVEEIFTPEIEKNPDIKKYCATMENLDIKGLFTRVLLREFLELGAEAYPEIPTESIKEETKNFVEFLEKIATKERGVDVPGGLSFEGNRIRTGLVLIARPEVRDLYGIDPYLNAVKVCVEKGINSIYILAAGRLNITAAKLVAQRLERSEEIKKIEEREYKLRSGNKDVKALCLLFKRVRE